uniref:Uncharacterized protein n=1 Tax=Tetranychus urticae TaxID=32264 RepID=T1KQ86_TETUR
MDKKEVEIIFRNIAIIIETIILTAIYGNIMQQIETGFR